MLVALTTACSSDIEDYHQANPKFDLFEYFEGETLAWGMVQDYSEKQTRRFEVSIVGTIEADTLTLVEDFVFDDGEISQRIWVINRLGDGQYEGTAADIIGVATGREVGNTLHWTYDFEIEVGDSKYTVALDDWLYRQDDTHVFNLTSIRKFGMEVGRITLFFDKQ
jgi:hypothetical protein